MTLATMCEAEPFLNATGLIPRPYQAEAARLGAAALRRRGNTLQVLPTGAGKTLVALLTAREVGFRKVLVVVHRGELVDQWLDACARVLPGRVRALGRKTNRGYGSQQRLCPRHAPRHLPRAGDGHRHRGAVLSSVFRRSSSVVSRREMGLHCPHRLIGAPSARWGNWRSFTMNKYEHVRNAPQSRTHTCHWPGCGVQVPPAKWGCQRHWYRLPLRLRTKIWATYRAGQEETMTPSRAYLEVAREIQEWIASVSKHYGKTEGQSSDAKSK